VKIYIAKRSIILRTILKNRERIMTDSFPAITIQTCEQNAGGEPSHPLVPRHGEAAKQFPVQDPFGLRKAVVPVFWVERDGMLTGYGTAFAVDPFGTFITADHVVANARLGARPILQRDGIRGTDRTWRFEMPIGEGLIVFLGVGLIYGTVKGPPGAMPRIVGTWTPACEGDDPMAVLQGRPGGKPLDLALISVAPWPPQGDWLRNLPFKARPRGPGVGDIVIAVGYPQIHTWHAYANEMFTTVREGMFAGYGRVTRLHPRGRDYANPTPVFEVEADWPCGMSGGPVFNTEGEVIGLVSRGLSPSDDQPVGHAWATWFEALPQLPRWAPTLDPENPRWRRCWAVMRREPWHLSRISPKREDAEKLVAQIGDGYEVIQGSWRLGTGEFVSASRAPF
jgi:serine protease Do